MPFRWQFAIMLHRGVFFRRELRLVLRCRLNDRRAGHEHQDSVRVRPVRNGVGKWEVKTSLYAMAIDPRVFACGRVRQVPLKIVTCRGSEQISFYQFINELLVFDAEAILSTAHDRHFTEEPCLTVGLQHHTSVVIEPNLQEMRASTGRKRCEIELIAIERYQ